MFDWVKSLFIAKPPIVLEHPEFGVLTYESGNRDSGLWSGELTVGQKDICFCVAGSNTATDIGLLDELRKVLGRFDEFERAALLFLCGSDEAESLSVSERSQLGEVLRTIFQGYFDFARSTNTMIEGFPTAA